VTETCRFWDAKILIYIFLKFHYIIVDGLILELIPLGVQNQELKQIYTGTPVPEKQQQQKQQQQPINKKNI